MNWGWVAVSTSIAAILARMRSGGVGHGTPRRAGVIRRAAARETLEVDRVADVPAPLEPGHSGRNVRDAGARLLEAGRACRKRHGARRADGAIAPLPRRDGRREEHLAAPRRGRVDIQGE